MVLTTRYIQNSLKLESPQMTRIKECTAKHKMVVVLGFSENVNNSLYISQAIIDADGEIRIDRKKIKPTHMEQLSSGTRSVIALTASQIQLRAE